MGNLAKRIYGFWIAILFICLVALFSYPSYAQKVNDIEFAIIVRVIDGDTLKIDYHGQKESVRLIGIDAPEFRKNPKAERDASRSGRNIESISAMGKESTHFAKGIVGPGDQVRIEFDVQPRDNYSRLLGYVWLADGRMLNEEMVKAGYASLMTYPPNVRYHGRFLKAYKEARESQKGLWRQ